MLIALKFYGANNMEYVSEVFAIGKWKPEK